MTNDAPAKGDAKRDGNSESNSTLGSKRPRLENQVDDNKKVNLNQIPTLFDNNLESFSRLYDQYQVVYIPKAATNAEFTWKNIGPLFQQLNAADQQSWCIETAGDTNKNSTPLEFLNNNNNQTTTAYCSFQVQHDSQIYQQTLPRLPFCDFPWNKQHYKYNPCLWFFVGWNHTTDPLPGRPEHTDSLSNALGTWHYQLSGTKQWWLRPTPQLGVSLPESKDGEVPRICVTCQEGDVLVINTRLWFHQTILPPAAGVPSVSYARDFANTATNNSSTNLDGLYATNDIESGTILFTEETMPDCELHRASSRQAANCQVVELEDGQQGVVSTRSILAGEFFCIPETSSSSENDSNEEEEEEEKDGSDVESS